MGGYLFAHAILLFLVAILNVCIGFVVFTRNKKAAQNRSFLALAASLALWAFGIGFFIVSATASSAIFYANIYYVAALLMNTSLYVYTVTLRSRVEKVHLIHYAVPLAFVAVLIATPNAILSKVTINLDLTKTVDINMALYAVYSVVIVGYFVAAATLLLRRSIQHRDQERLQLLTVLAGVLMTGILSIYFNLYLPAIGQYNLIWFGPELTIIFLIAISFAVVRYRLFDLRVVLARSSAYIFALIVSLTLYVFILFTIGSAFLSHDSQASTQSVVFVALAVLLTLTFQPLKNFFDKVTDALFLQYQYEPQHVVTMLGDAVVGRIELKGIMHDAVTIIDEALHPVASELVVLHTDRTVADSYASRKPILGGRAITKKLHEHGSQLVNIDQLDQDIDIELEQSLRDADVVIAAKLSALGHDVGYLLLGPKENGNEYTKTDLYLINTASDELAMAVQNCLRFDEIKAFNKTLQSRINTATVELQNSNKKLHELDEAKDEFISMASHQLRTPLTSVKGYISMVLEGDAGELQPMQRRLLEEAFASSQRMVYLIGDFLNVSRLKTGKFILTKSPVNLAKTITEEVEQLHQTAAGRHLKLQYDPPINMPLIDIDETKIRQVIMNIVDNAIFYSPENSAIVIEVIVRVHEVVFQVKDKGIGVPKLEQHHLFTKFYRATNARKVRPDGTGIGLFMAKKVVIAHHGSVIFESIPGKGSTFGFRLPLKTSA